MLLSLIPRALQEEEENDDEVLDDYLCAKMHLVRNPFPLTFQSADGVHICVHT